MWRREKGRETKSNLHLNLSMIFPPHSVAKAILTANTEILPWPSLFHGNRKKKKIIFCSVELTGQLMHYVNNPFEQRL